MIIVSSGSVKPSILYFSSVISYPSSPNSNEYSNVSLDSLVNYSLTWLFVNSNVCVYFSKLKNGSTSIYVLYRVCVSSSYNYYLLLS